MEKYQPNSHKYKQEKKESQTEDRKIEKIVSGTAKIKKKSEMRKFKDVFISDDATNVKSYIFADVLVPAIKKLISDIVKDGIEMILYGGTGSRDRFSSGSRLGYISYDKYSDRRGDRRDRAAKAQTRFDYDDIVFENRGEAEAARAQMEEVIERYGFVTVADLYDMADLSAPYTSNKYGWTNIRSAEPVRLREGGYILKLPRAMPID